MYVGRIQEGIVLDHLQRGYATLIAEKFDLGKRNVDYTTGNAGQKSFLKVHGIDGLVERKLKIASQLSPEPVVNIVRDGNVDEKFVYLLCKNDNCVTNAINEDVPPTFYRDEEIVRCRYCRRPYNFTSPKISNDEWNRFAGSLPSKLMPVIYDNSLVKKR